MKNHRLNPPCPNSPQSSQGFAELLEDWTKTGKEASWKTERVPAFLAPWHPSDVGENRHFNWILSHFNWILFDLIVI